MIEIDTRVERYRYSRTGPWHYDVYVYFNGKAKCHLINVGGKNEQEAKEKGFKIIETISEFCLNADE